MFTAADPDAAAWRVLLPLDSLHQSAATIGRPPAAEVPSIAAAGIETELGIGAARLEAALRRTRDRTQLRR